MKKGLLVLLGTLCLTLVLTALPFMAGCAAEEKVVRIGECVIIEHPDLFADQEGFHEVVDSWAAAKGVTVEYTFQCAEGDMSLAKTIADRFVSEKMDLIHAITTPNAQACVAAAEGSGIPVVFSTCTAPAAAGIVSTWDAPRPDANVTGVSDMAAMKPQMEMIKEICPDVKVLGVIYNAGEPNSVVQVGQMKELMADVGIEELVEANCSTTAEVATAAASLIGRCDAIYIPTDNTAVSGLEAIIAVAEENKIPFFGSTGDMVDRGCIAGQGADYYWIGQEAGRYATRILEGESPGDIPVVMCAPEACKLVVNPGAAERMGITIPQSVIDKAERIAE